MSDCPLKMPCDRPKNLVLLVMEGNEERTINVCQNCPLAKQIHVLEKTNDHCPRCNTKFKDLADDKKLGCEFCYVFMGSSLESLIERVQDGSKKHKGKKPSKENLPVLQRFFNQIVDEYGESHPDSVKSCERLKKLLARYF